MEKYGRKFPRDENLAMSRNSTRARRICVDTHKRQDAMGLYMICHVCKSRLNLTPPTTEFHADHIRRYAEGGEDTPENLWPICIPCHKPKSAKDTTEVAKGKRYSEKHYGIRQSKNPMPGSKRSGWKKRLDGTVVKR